MLFLLILLLPSQVSLHLWPSWSFVHGLPIDYLAPTIYTTDLILLLLLILSKSSFRLPLPLIVIAVINTATSILPTNTVFFWLRLFEYYWLYKHIVSRPYSPSTIKNALFLASIWVSILAIWQFTLQHSAGGVWSILFGEHTFNAATPFIATSTFMGERILRAYSTFPHPNALAGFLLVCLFLVKIKNKYFLYPYYFLLVITLLITFSRTAFLTLGIVALYCVLSKLKKASVASVLQTKSITERFEFQSHAISQIFLYPLTGVGLGNFIPSLPATINLQPVHNIFLLLLTELGIPVTLYILYTVCKKIQLTLSPLIIIIVVTGLFDHYWLTLHQNQLFLTILLAYLTLQSKAAWKN